MPFSSFAQTKERYVEAGSIHALTVSENSDYNFEWTITYGENNEEITVSSTTNVTENIHWDNIGTYYVTVVPVLDSVGCAGEPVELIVYVVEYLSLYTFDDVYFTHVDDSVSGDVSENDFDETGSDIYYTPTPVIDPQHGAVELLVDGTFTYTPDSSFAGVDSFMYEAFNSSSSPMYSNSMVYIVVQDEPPSATDLSVEKTGPEKALYGSEIQYTIVVINNGTATAKNVVLKDTLAFGLSDAQYALEDDTGDKKDWTGYLNLGDMNPGDTIVVYIYGTISDYSPDVLYNQALAYAPNAYDPDHINNDSIWKTKVSAIYVDLPGQVTVSSCDTTVLDVTSSESNNPIASYLWTPSTGLSDSTVANPVFTPDTSTIGSTIQYVLTVTDTAGFEATDTMLVIVLDEPEAVIAGDTLFRDLGEKIIVSGSESTGDGLTYFWWTNDGDIVGKRNADSIVVDSVGMYYLSVTDELGCESYDSVLVLFESHPPVTVSDIVAIPAGYSVVLPENGAAYLALADDPDQQLAYLESLPDSNVNVLDNDYDRNGFNLEVTEVVTAPLHSTYSWDSTGVFVITPDSSYWGTDSLQYRVCNNGIPVQCSMAWIIINCLRLPLNADVVIEKTGDAIAFWNDTISYQLTVYNTGPDTVDNITITDDLYDDFYDAMYSTDNGETWDYWWGTLNYTDTILPGEDTLYIQIKATVPDTTTDRYIENMAYIETDIIENELENDTARITTKLKVLVKAEAGPDLILGSCQEDTGLDGSESTGENLEYLWTPSTYLDDPTAVKPVFTNPGEEKSGNYLIYLTVTDDDNISDTDSVTIRVLEPPVADAGDTKYIEEGEEVVLNATGSEGSLQSYYWETPDGNILTDPNSSLVFVDTVGTYILTVTDSAGCTDTDTVNVYWFYYYPFAIPDYYSMYYKDSKLVVSDSVYGVLYNDYEPNGMFTLSIDTANSDHKSYKGGKVVLNKDGTFTYTLPTTTILKGAVDHFTYTVCNNAYPARCSKGYVQITVNDTSSIANLNITKEVVEGHEEVLIGLDNDVRFTLTARNLGPDKAKQVTITDSLSAYLTDYKYKVGTNLENIEGDKWPTWDGSYSAGNIAAGDSVVVNIRATATSSAPKRVFNAATVASITFDDEYFWDDIKYRNVDTASVWVTDSLRAVAELVEAYSGDDDHNDATIGYCDDESYLTAEQSSSLVPIDTYQWEPSEYLTSPDSTKTYFNPPGNDTTITFTLYILAGENGDFATVTVHFSPEVIADAGPDRKINEGETLVIDGTNSQGADATYKWYEGSTNITNSVEYEDGNLLKPVISETGTYYLLVEDKHGCTDMDTVYVRENSLFAVNDFIVVITNDTLIADVGINDYDPDDDSIYYTGRATQPQHGNLLDSNKVADDGTFVYVPDKNYIGSDYFYYEIRDNNDPSLSQEGKVYIHVIDVDSINSPPVANPDYFFVDKNDTLESDVMANDYDFDGGTIKFGSVVTSPSKGKITSIDENGNFEYIPSEDAVEKDSFLYRIVDNGSPKKYDTACVTIYIHKLEEENHRPVAVDDAFYAVEKSIEGNILLNDYDPDGDVISLNTSPVSGPSDGTFTLNSDGSFEYTPDLGFEGTDQIIYQIRETGTSDRYSSYATIYITSLDEKRYTTDLAIEKTAPAEILSGSTIKYTLHITVEGPTLANDVVISDTLFSNLTNIYYSFDTTQWYSWTGSQSIEQMMLYDDTTIYIKADIPDTLSGSLPNTGYVYSDMSEKDSTSNVSEVETWVYQRVIANAGTDTIIGACVEEFQLDGTKSIGMTDDLEYSWLPADLLDNPNSAQPVFTTEPDETQVFMLVVSDEVSTFSDSDTAYVTVEVASEPVADAGSDQTPDDGEIASLDGSGSYGAEPLEYLWWKYDDNDSIVVLDSTVTLSVDRSGSYYLTVTDKYGCSATDRVNISYPIDPFDAIDDIITTYQQTPVDIYVLRNDIIDEDDEYDLDLLMVTESPQHGTVEEYPYDSMFTYTPEMYYHGLDTFVYSASTKSWTDNANVIIEVLEKPPVVPEGFSPNGDGINDYLIIDNIDLYEESHFIVFNRWGNIVYETDNYSNDDPWDGIATRGVRIGNGPLPAGVYYYILDLGKNENISQRILKGYFYIASSK